MNGIDKITGRISEDAQREIDAIQAQASQQAGFGSYPAFLRAFRQTYHALPSQLKGGQGTSI